MTSVDTLTSVYQYHDALGRLLYVGITSRGRRRQHEHARSKPWWHLVTGCTIEHYPDRESAAERERRLIEKFHPPFNVVFNKQHADAAKAFKPLVPRTGPRVVVSPLTHPNVGKRKLARRAWYEMDEESRRIAPCTSCGGEVPLTVRRTGPECPACRPPRHVHA